MIEGALNCLLWVPYEDTLLRFGSKLIRLKLFHISITTPNFKKRQLRYKRWARPRLDGHWPLYPKGVPASLAEGASKKEVYNVLLRRVTAEQTHAIIILDSVMSSLEHVSSVQSVRH